MTRFLTPFILIAIAVASFFTLTDPLFSDIKDLRAQSASYDEALNNSKALENERDKLTKKYNDITPDNLIRIKKLLPDNIDNIRLILEIGQVASPHGMVLKNVKYDTEQETAPASGFAVQGGPQSSAEAEASRKEYGAWNLEFSTEGTYNNFLNFVKDLEKNLRIVDISSITFSSEVGAKGNPFLPDVYIYTFKIRTYWLKN